MESSLSVDATVSEEPGNRVEDERTPFSSSVLCICHKIPDTDANMSITSSDHMLSHAFLLLSKAFLVVSQGC